eukprot:scaffold7245_cov197-Ochromonas_danica.AAC.6
MFLKLEKLQARDLVDTSTVTDSQDPCLIIKVGNEEHETSRVKHAGANADFIESYELEIDGKGYADGSLEISVEVVNRGYGGKQRVHIGLAQASLKALLPAPSSSATTITLDLTHYAKSGEQKKKGKVMMVATLSDVPFATKDLEPVVIQQLNDDTKTELLTQAFGDVGELVDDFHCGYMGSSLICYGRLYVTTRYLCFYSRLFGRENKVRIPFDHVREITRSADIFKLKAILNVDAGRNYRFHSFWDFESSFRSVCHALDIFRDQRNLLIPVSNQATASEIVDESLPLAARRGSSSSATASTTTDEGEADDALQAFKKEAERSRGKTVVLSQQPLPVTLATFSRLFLEDDAPFSFKAFHESMKDSSVAVSLWQEVVECGLRPETAREIKFFKPVNLPGLASTRGVKMQNLKRFDEAGLLLCSCTHLEDVPAADCFSVDDTLEVASAVGGSGVLVTISFQVTFVKSTMMKSLIVGPTNSEMKKWMTTFFDYLKKACADSKTTGSSSGQEKDSTKQPVATAAAAGSSSTLAVPTDTTTSNPLTQLPSPYLLTILVSFAICFVALFAILTVLLFSLARDLHELTASVNRCQELLLRHKVDF